MQIGIGRPNDSRGFLHKSFIGKAIGGAVKKFVPVLGIAQDVIGAGRSFFGQPKGSKQRARDIRQGGGFNGGFAPIITDAPGGFFDRQACNPGFEWNGVACVPIRRGSGIVEIPGRSNCPPNTVWDPGVRACVSPSSEFGQGALADQFGEAVNGRYGAGLLPAVRMTDTRTCPRGSVLGNDGVCYNKRDLKNSEREWPRGQRPLLTGGEMRAIRIAAGAAKKLQVKTKQLQSLGMLKRPTSRRRALPPGVPGHHTHQAHD